MALYKEVWESCVAEGLKLTDFSFAESIPDKSSLAVNNVIHIAQAGISPEVFINHTGTFNTVPRVDVDMPVSLDRFDTENTPVTEDELTYLAYDKVASVTKDHISELQVSMHTKGIYNFAVTQDTPTTPIVKTTGTVNVGNGRKMCTLNDILALKSKMDLMKISAIGRVLVLHPEHYNDLLAQSTVLAQTLLSLDPRKSFSLYGFNCYCFGGNPIYDQAFTKKIFGSSQTATDRIASIAFSSGRSLKALGKVKMFTKIDDPQTRQSEYGFRTRSVMMPTRLDHLVTLVSNN